MNNPATQKKVLLIIIAILLVANAFTLYMLMQKPESKKMRSRKAHMEQYLKKELGFNESQMKSFDSLQEKHKLETERMIENSHSEKQRRFDFLAKNNFSDSAISYAVSDALEEHKNVETKMLRYIGSLRQLATMEQQVKFDTTFIKYISKNKKRSKKQ